MTKEKWIIVIVVTVLIGGAFFLGKGCNSAPDPDTKVVEATAEKASGIWKVIIFLSPILLLAAFGYIHLVNKRYTADLLTARAKTAKGSSQEEAAIASVKSDWAVENAIKSVCIYFLMPTLILLLLFACSRLFFVFILESLLSQSLLFLVMVVTFFVAIFGKKGSVKRRFSAITCGSIAVFILMGYVIPSNLSDIKSQASTNWKVSKEVAKNATSDTLAEYRAKKALKNGEGAVSMEGLAKSLHLCIQAYDGASSDVVRKLAKENLDKLEVKAEIEIPKFYAGNWENLAYSSSAAFMYRYLARSYEITGDGGKSSLSAQMMQKIQVRCSYSNIGKDWNRIKPDWADPDETVAFKPPF